MNKQLKLICTLFVLSFFGCNSGEHQSTEQQTTKSQEEAFLIKDGKAVQFSSHSHNVLSKLVATPYSLATLQHKIKDCSDYFCINPMGENKIYRRSRNKKYYIQYDPTTTLNTLFDLNTNTNTKLGSAKIESNNPEFSVETIPLEDEPGILLTDGIYGFTKFELEEKQLKKAFKINFDKQWQHEKFIVINESNSLLVFKRHLQKGKAFADFYSLKDGALLFSKPIDNQYKQIKYFSKEKALAFYGKDAILLSDENCKTILCEISASISGDQLYLSTSLKSLSGLYRSASGFSTFDCLDSGLKTSKYLVQDGINTHQFFDVKNHFGTLYSKFQKEGNSYKLVLQGLIIINKTTEDTYKINLPDEAAAQISDDNNEALICKIGTTAYLVDLNEL